MMRIFAILFIVAVVGGLILFSDFYGDPDPRTGVTGNVLVPEPPQPKIPAELFEPRPVGSDVKEEAPPVTDGTPTVETPTVAPSIKEGVYVRATSGRDPKCSLSAYDSVAIKRKGDGFVLIGDNDPMFEATYQLVYSPDSGACSFSLRDWSRTYTYICGIDAVSDSGAPRISIFRIVTTEQFEEGQRRSTCEDGESFVLKQP